MALKKSLFHIIQKVCAVAGLDLFSSVDGHLDNSRGDHGRYGRHHSCYGGGDLNYVEGFRCLGLLGQFLSLKQSLSKGGSMSYLAGFIKGIK